LIQDVLTDNANQVPFLGNIPIIGTLFRYDNREHTKTNLMVFLKPTVVRSGTEAHSLTADRYDYLMGEQQRLKPEAAPFWTEPMVPQLPPLPLPPGDGGAAPSGVAPPPQ
jgi:general secretion pathway protein D